MMSRTTGWPDRHGWWRRLVGLGIAAGLAVGLLASAGSGPQPAAAFDQTWYFKGCVNVTEISSQYRLWDGAPGAGSGKESGYLFVNANDDRPEQCTWWTGQMEVEADVLVAWAAVNDGAALTIAAFGATTCSGTPLASVTFPLQEPNRFHPGVDEFSAADVKAICVTLADSPASAQQRISALIDDIVLLRNTQNVWFERFERAG